MDFLGFMIPLRIFGMICLAIRHVETKRPEQLVKDQLLMFFESQEKLHVKGNGDQLLIHRKRRAICSWSRGQPRGVYAGEPGLYAQASEKPGED